MKYEEWEPIYKEICEYFCYDSADDEKAANLLKNLTSSDATTTLHDLIIGRPVTVCGNAPCLSDECSSASGVIIAADAAAGVLLQHKIRPDVIVTDLDGIDEYASELNRSGTILVIHAHGDNISRIYTWVPRFTGPVVCTTQGLPFSNIHNFGGFTDGDRAVFLAYEMEASSVKLIGFDCNDPDVPPMKKGKLFWAHKLLQKLGHDC